MAIVAQHVSLPPPDPRAPGPFAFADPAYVADILSVAGFHDLECTPWRGTQWIGRGMDAAATAGFVIDALFVGEALRDSPASVKAEVRQSIAKLLRTRETPEGVGMPSMAWVVTGRM